MKTIAAGLLVLVAGVIAGTTAHAYKEVTFAEVKGVSAEPIPREELETLLSGATYQGENATHAWSQKYSTDGKVAGSGALKFGGTQAGNWGKWWVSKDGRWCSEMSWQGGGSKWCSFVYRFGTEYVGFGPKAVDSTKSWTFSLTK